MADLPLYLADWGRCSARYGSRDFEADWNRGRLKMTRKYSLVVETGPNGCSAYVPELPSILVTGTSGEELAARAAEDIQIYWDVLRSKRSPTSELREIEVELPA